MYRNIKKIKKFIYYSLILKKIASHVSSNPKSTIHMYIIFCFLENYI